MAMISYGTLAEANSSDFLGRSSILSTKGTDVLAIQPDATIFAYNPGDIAWVLATSIMVWFMVPGIAFLYSGTVQGKNALSLLLLPMLAMAVVSIQWWFWGYSLAFSPHANAFIGDLSHVGFENVLSEPEQTTFNKIPGIVFALLQQQQAALVGAVAIGAAAERGRIGPSMIFLFVWATLVYCPLVAWMYNEHGWALKWGILDYGGGVTMEICSGMTGLAYSIFIGRRRGYGIHKHHPHNVPHVALGTAFLWFGWLGLNGAGTFAANVKAALVMVNTHLAACAGGLVWIIMDFRFDGKWTLVGFCLGAICGMVSITPAGYVGASASVLIGAIASALSNTAVNFRHKLPWDDGLDIFGGHAISGVVGVILTGVFASKTIAQSDGHTVIEGGMIDKNYKQMYKQLVWVLVGSAWSFVVTYLIMMVINVIPYCHFRATEESEVLGMDADQSGEKAYVRHHLHFSLFFHSLLHLIP
ncbi:ammonium transporter AmtB-like domain-containing protein [Melampsora americana]|nr:ammonium transporter AmtB-like domain-containing protein [Melampsora americana]